MNLYIAYAKRTAIGTLLGSLSSIKASKLGSLVIQDLMKKCNLPNDSINEVILGQAITGGTGQNPARQSLIDANLSDATPAFTINKVCGSGLKAVILAAQSILTGDNQIVIAGGQENMSLGMHGFNLRKGYKFGEVKLVDQMQYDGLTDAFSNEAMGVTAENIVSKYNISRELQDRFAVNSHKKAAYARDNDWFKNEILGIDVQIGKQTIIFEQDENIRNDSSIEQLAKLKSVFKNDGSVTAGNSSSINDGAATVLLVSETALKKYNLTPLARIISYASSGVDPNFMGTGPINAIKLALNKASWKIEDLDLIEVNEAFAAQSICVINESGFDNAKVNIAGGAIALGHPIGASGCRVLVTLVHQMQRLKLKRGLVTLCIGGGMGVAMCIENINQVLF